MTLNKKDRLKFKKIKKDKKCSKGCIKFYKKNKLLVNKIKIEKIKLKINE